MAKGNPNWVKKKETMPEEVKSALLANPETEQETVTELNPEVEQEKPPQIARQTKEQFEIEQLRQELRDMQQLIRDGFKAPQQAVIFKQEDKAFGIYDSSNISTDDFMETPRKYVKFGKGFELAVYIKNGVQVKAPFNKGLYFQKMFDEVVYQENNTKVIPFCMFQTNSKAEAKFVEESPLYNILIFDDYKKASSIDPNISDKVEQAIHMIQNLKDNEVMAAATGYGIDLRQSKERLKSSLIKIKISELTSQEDIIKTRRIEEIQKNIFAPASE